MKYSQFIFKDYDFRADSGRLSLRYSYDNQLNFTEVYDFNFEFVDYNAEALYKAIELLFLVAGVSYYKAYLAPQIVVEKGRINSDLAGYLKRTYQNGLGEFFYLNKLGPDYPVEFPVNSQDSPEFQIDNSGYLIGLGGGKDSLVSVELLRDQPRVATWSLNHRSQLEPLVNAVDLPHFWVDRQWDPQLQKLNQQDALNGHVPISAIFSCVGLIVAILTGRRDVVVSNESSASEPTMHYKGHDINHQYSKSLAYEQDFQALVGQVFGPGLRYYSFLRPFSELRIAEIFSQVGFEKYKSVFSSCNRAFTHDQHRMFWCGACAKCAFVFLILTPFIERSQLESLWNGKNLLLDPDLEATYKQLLGIAGDKPFDCVGEVKEARAAMRLAQQSYPELSKYEFDIPKDYNFRALSQHSMPAEVFDLLRSKLAG